MSLNYFIDTRYKKVKISYLTYIQLNKEKDDSIFWTKNYGEDGLGQYEFYKFSDNKTKQFPLLYDHIKICYYCLKTNTHKGKCVNCKKINYKKVIFNFKIVLHELQNPKAYWDNFLNTNYSCKIKYYKDLKKFAKRTFNKNIFHWYLTFHKGMPDYFIVMSPSEVSKFFPKAKNWYDVENYM